MFKWFSKKSKSDEVPKLLGVGEVQGDYIGCYLLWFKMKGDDEISYQSVATSKEKLIEDYISFFGAIVESKEQSLAQMPDRRPKSETYTKDDGSLVMPTDDLIRNGHEHDLKVAKNCLKNTKWVDLYLDEDNSLMDKEKPFITLGHMDVWMDIGMRPRQKISGKYIE